jgi:O-methyltransferase
MTARATGSEEDMALEQPRPPKTPVFDDEDFLALASVVKSHGRTMLPQKRLWTLWQCVANVASLDGHAAEIGAYRGGSAYFIAASFLRRLGREVPMDVIDTFEGHPAGKLSEHDSAIHADGSKFLSTSYESVVDYLSPFEHLTVRKGDFSAVAADLPQRTYRLVHVDVDLYVPALECLRYFGPRLVRGGILLLDDYGAAACPGIRQAADEYLAGGGFQTWDTRSRQLVLVKL